MHFQTVFELVVRLWNSFFMSSSTEQFDQRLSSLKLDLKSYGDDIVEHVMSLYDKTQQGSRFELKNDPFGMVGVLQMDVGELLKECQGNADYRNRHSAEIAECDRLTKVLAHMSQTMEKISECETLIAKSSLVAACNYLAQLDSVINGLPSSSTELGMGKVCKALRKEHNLLKARLSAKVDRIFKEAIQFEFGHVTVHRELKGILRSEDAIIAGTIALTDVWAALNLLQREEQAVEGVLHSVWLYLLKPLWREKKLQAPRSSRLEEPSVSELVLESIVREGKALESASRNKSGASSSGGSAGRGTTLPELGACKMPLSQLLEGLGQVLAFVHSEVLCANEKVGRIRTQCSICSLHSPLSNHFCILSLASRRCQCWRSN